MTCNRDDPPGFTCGGSRKYQPCGQHFGSLAAFDWHLRRPSAGGGPGQRCATPAELRDAGYVLSDNGVWRTPMDEEVAARLGRTVRARAATPQDILGLFR